MIAFFTWILESLAELESYAENYFSLECSAFFQLPVMVPEKTRVSTAQATAFF